MLKPNNNQLKLLNQVKVKSSTVKQSKPKPKKERLIYLMGDTVTYNDDKLDKDRVYKIISFVQQLVVIQHKTIIKTVPFGVILPTRETYERMLRDKDVSTPKGEKKLQCGCIVKIPCLSNKDAFLIHTLLKQKDGSYNIIFVNGMKRTTANFDILNKSFKFNDIKVILSKEEVDANKHPYYGRLNYEC